LTQSIENRRTYVAEDKFNKMPACLAEHLVARQASKKILSFWLKMCLPVKIVKFSKITEF